MSVMDARWAFILVAGWLAATVSGVAGFGGALLLLPVLAIADGARAAVPILTVAQLLGNLSRAGLGWREVRWRPALRFGAGAVPACLIGARVFLELPTGSIHRVIGAALLAMIAFRRSPLGGRPIPEAMLAPLGFVVGLISSIAGSAGPLGAAVFLGLRLPPRAYVASEALTAVLIHLTKAIAYGRSAALNADDLSRGLALGGAMVLGSWTGRRLLGRLPARGFDLLVEVLLAIAAAMLLLG